MSVEAVKIIRDCEAEARKIREEGDTAAKQLLQKAHSDGQLLVERMISEAEKKAICDLEANDEKIRSLTSDNEKKTDEEVVAIYNKGLANKNAAVERICSEILNKL